MHKILLLLSLLLMNSLLANAQFQVTVLDAQDSKPLSGANILALNTGEIYTTDSLGQTSIGGAEGKYLVSYVGFKSREISIEKNTEKIFLEPDLQFLREVEVRGHENNTDYLSVAGAYNLVGHDMINNYGPESLVRAVNTIPGIRMEERSPASYRVSIRGSLLRAPFGVRNIKVYWNDIPFTDATGNAFLYFLDNENVGKIEVIKGPSGSMYGAGMGGVLLLKSGGSAEAGFRSSIGITAGSFGLRTLDLSAGFQHEKVQSNLSYSGFQTNGYREHTDTERNVFQWQSTIENSGNNKMAVNVLYSNLFYELPGGLTREQYAADPHQARQISVDQDASVDHENFLIGINNQHSWGARWHNSTSLYFSNGTKENPFNTNYELERTTGAGGRTRFVKSAELWGNPLYQTAGLEAQYGKFHANNHDNNGGYAGALRYEDESEIFQGFVFAQAEYMTKTDWIFTFGASLNYLQYDIHRLRDVALDSSYAFARTFNPVVSPRLGVVKKLSKNSSVHGSISEGFSPPSQDEIRTSDGEINRDLEAERGISYEIGYRGNTPDGKLMFDITAFYMQQVETIVSRTSETGVSKFENAGATSQKGVEALLSWKVIDNPSQPVSRLKLQTALTYHNFKFKDYIKSAGEGNADFSGNELTGTSPFIAVTSLDIAFNFGGYVFISHNYTDAIPLNDANTVYASGYHLVTAKAGWQIDGKNDIDIFAGVDNLLNKKYSLGNDLNAFGERYFEPSPARNYYFGMKLYF